MKKFILTIFITILTTFSFAQSLSFGVKAGANLSTVAYNGAPPTSYIYVGSNQNRVGYQFGATADVEFKHFSIQPELFFITKGGKYTEEFEFPNNNQPFVVHESGNTKVNYLELPINLLYKMQATPAVKIYAGGGPYMDYSLSGKFGQHVTEPTTTYDNQGNISFGNDHNKDDKRINYGINFIIGTELNKHFTIDLNYSLGLTSVAWDITDRNRTTALSIGYHF